MDSGNNKSDKSCCYGAAAVKSVKRGKFRLARRYAVLSLVTMATNGRRPSSPQGMPPAHGRRPPAPKPHRSNKPVKRPVVKAVHGKSSSSVSKPIQALVLAIFGIPAMFTLAAVAFVATGGF